VPSPKLRGAIVELRKLDRQVDFVDYALVIKEAVAGYQLSFGPDNAAERCVDCISALGASPAP